MAAAASREPPAQPVTNLQAIVDALPHGLCVVDAADRVVLFNRLFLELLDLGDAPVAVGATIGDLGGLLLAAGHFQGLGLEAVLERRRARFSDRRAYDFEEVTPSGRVLAVHHEPMPDGGWTSTYRDVTQRRQAQDRLAQQHHRFELALTSMTHGLLVLDREQRVIVVNPRYLAMYGFSPDDVRLGATTARDLTLATARRGGFPGYAPEEAWALVEGQLSRRAHLKVSHRSAGGGVTAITYAPTPEGGWILTFDDTTEARRAEHELRRQARLFDAAIEHMPQGLCMIDEEGRMIARNSRFRELFGLSLEATLPGTPVESLSALGPVAPRAGDGVGPGGAATRLRRLSDGRSIAVNRWPMRGGFVTTYEDVTERRQQERALRERKAALREQNRWFDAALNNMSQGLILLDPDLRIIVANARYREIFGLEREDTRPGTTLASLIERSVAEGLHGTRTAQEIVAARLAVFAAGQPTSIRFPLAPGRTLEVTYRPMPKGAGWVVTYDDVTERLATSLALADQNARFDAALNHMSQGLVMLDAGLRVIVANARYRELFDLAPEAVRPGTPLADIVRRGVERGYHPGRRPQEMVEERLAIFAAGLPATLRLELAREGAADGPCIIEASYRPMPHGGWVVTYDDVTERLATERAVREQNARFDAALNNMSEGLCMLDRDLRVIVVNQRYLDLYGLSPEVARPGVTMRAIMEYSVALGNHPEITAEALYQGYRAHLDAHPDAVIHRRLTDGRTIEITHEPMPGGGWVATYDDITERLRAEERIQHIARHDALTGLPNRTLLRHRMGELLARDGERSLAVLCLDLDRFKMVNDTLGHLAGDELLKQVAGRIRACLGPADVAARLGGDEFAVLQAAPRSAQPEAVERLAAELVAALGRPFQVEGQVIDVGTSIGIALAPGHGEDADLLMRHADLALYKAKSDGRNTHRVFVPAMDEQVQARRALEVELRRAFAQGEFQLHYQPVLNLAANRISGVEALLRWPHPQRGFVPPASFVPLAEDIGLIDALSDWVLREACRQATSFPPGTRVAVNLSPAQFRGRGVATSIIGALALSGLSPRCLEVEITESVLLQENESTLGTLHQLRDLGVRICLDDFGTGYSSLSYLRSFPFDKIKIDRSFIRDLGAREDSLAIVRAVVGLARSLGMSTTAEGVETEAQLAFVRQEGCTEVQGYLVSRPRPAAELLSLPAFQMQRVA